MYAILLWLSSATPSADLSAPERVVRFSVWPSAAATPALRYQLLPEVRELHPGNPVQWYLRCFAEQRNFFFAPQSVEQRARYLRMPLNELPAAELKGYGGSALSQADWGARLDTPDWQGLDRIESHPAEKRYPELEVLGRLAEGLHVRLRGEFGRGDYEAATETAKTLFALARHLGDYPASAGSRLGLSIASVGLDALEEMVQQSNCPNLYWAITNLPAPLVEIRRGLQGDCVLSEAAFKSLRNHAMTSKEIEELVSLLSGASGFSRLQRGDLPRNIWPLLEARVKDQDALVNTRLSLVGRGNWNALSLPAEQVILLDEKHAFEIQRDEEMKLAGLTPWQAGALQRALPVKSSRTSIVAELLPPIARTRFLQARFEQRVGVLRLIEVLRLYAATHNGSLPATLDHVDLPLPSDPFTGKAFRFTCDGRIARILFTLPQEEKMSRLETTVFEVTLQRPPSK